jgi:hypothetical protein
LVVPDGGGQEPGGRPWKNSAAARRRNDLMPETTDKRIVEEMWTVARNEPLTLAGVVAFGVVDRERYQRRVGNVVLSFTLDCDHRTNIWSYELGIADAAGGVLDDEVVQYWLRAFFGREASLAARRGFLMSGEARYTFPYRGH